MDGSCPNRRTSPRLGGSKPSSILISVVLPAPLAPSRPTTSRGATWRSTSRTAAKWPNTRVAPMLCASNSVMTAPQPEVPAPVRPRSPRPADPAWSPRAGAPAGVPRQGLRGRAAETVPPETVPPGLRRPGTVPLEPRARPSAPGGIQTRHVPARRQARRAASPRSRSGEVSILPGTAAMISSGVPCASTMPSSSTRTDAARSASSR